MKIIVCVDDFNGMTFNNRRQSRDSAVINKILSLTQNSRLLISSYSKNLFLNGEAEVSPSPLKSALPEDFCFIENEDVSAYFEHIDSFIIFRWNRRYPSDLKFTLDLQSYRLVSSEDFPGTSHDKITMEVYEK